MRLLRYTTVFLLSCILFCLWQRAIIAAKRSYVVYLGAHTHGSELTSDDLNQVTESHYQFLGSFLGRNDNPEDAIFCSYTRHINGFAANLDDAVAVEIAKHPKVVSVFLNQGKKLHTTHSWEFLGVEHSGRIPRNSIWKKARYGEDTIIGNIDSGVWPESKSFSDDGFGPIPSKWKGICQNDKDAGFKCNRKLIGARYFNKGYAALVGPLNSSFESPRDNNGHGSHTLSTAGGNFVAKASIFGYGKGTAKGGSPKARVAAYKACWPPVAGNDCNDADVLAAFDMAIHDGVDVLSVSLGIQTSGYFNDTVAIGSFHAVKHGIVVICSAGNSGPADRTVLNAAPWQFTVGASTIDRDFPSYVVLGNSKRFKGQSLSVKGLPGNKFFPLISGADAKLANARIENALLCEEGALDREKVKGKIVLCLPGINSRAQAVLTAVGLVVANRQEIGNDLAADPDVLPVSYVKFTDGVAVFSYINSTEHPVGYITRATTELGKKPAPFMYALSSKGPNTITPEILKPDITAPGVNIIAAFTETKGPTYEYFGKRRIPFISASGTSMACPHVSGIAGLLKTLYPDWSPAAIKSAIITTATILDRNKETILNASYFAATPFSYGAGHLQPNLAMNPGLVYDLTVNDYLNFLCALGYNKTQIALVSGNTYTCPKNVSLANFNYPSITVPKLSCSITVTRTVKNVGSLGTYTAHVKKPKGISVSVVPKSLKFMKIGEEKSFKITLKLKKANTATKDYVFGDMIWSDDKQHHVRSPIVVKAV